MNEPSWSVPSVPGYTVVDVDVLVIFGSITWKALCVDCDSAIWEALCPLSEASGLSERLELRDLMEGVFERFGEMMCSLPLQETMRVAMRSRDKRTRVQYDLFQLILTAFPYFGS